MRIGVGRRYIYDGISTTLLAAAESPTRREGGPGFEEFLGAELRDLASYAVVLTRNRQDAHDVLAEVLVAAQLRWRKIGAMAAPLGCVRRMVANRFLSDQRRWSRRMIRSVAPTELPELPVPDPADDIDRRGSLRPLLAALPRQQRAVVVLRFYLGLDHAEISRELGITAGAVRTALSRGLAALRIALDDPHHGEEAGVAAAVGSGRADGETGWRSREASYMIRSDPTEDE